MMIPTLLLGLWVLIGIVGLMMDWISDFDLTVEDLFICIIAGSFMGPFSLLYWGCHYVNSGKVLIKRRK